MKEREIIDSRGNPIVEDDVIFVDNFLEKFKIGLEHTPEDYDILYLGCFGCQNKYNYHTIMNRRFNFKKINKYVNIPGIAFATHGYIVSRKGAKKLVKYLDKNIYQHIDYTMQQLHINKLINDASLGCVMTIREAHPFMWVTKDNLIWEPSGHERQLRKRRQELDISGWETGGCYSIKIRHFEEKNIRYPEPTGAVSVSHLESLDIDTIDELETASQILKIYGTL